MTWDTPLNAQRLPSCLDHCCAPKYSAKGILVQPSCSLPAPRRFLWQSSARQGTWLVAQHCALLWHASCCWAQFQLPQSSTMRTTTMTMSTMATTRTMATTMTSMRIRRTTTSRCWWPAAGQASGWLSCAHAGGQNWVKQIANFLQPGISGCCLTPPAAFGAVSFRIRHHA